MTKKWTRLISLFLLVTLFVIGAVACKSEEPTSPAKDDGRITLSFDTMGGDPIDSVKLKAATALKIRDLPIAYKSGHIFSEWFLDPELKEPFTGSDGVISSNTTLYAGYTEQTVKEISWKDTSETSLLDQPADKTLLIAPNGGTLTDENLSVYMKVTNHFEAIDDPAFSVEKSGDNYILSAVGGWPESGMYTLELKSPFKFLVDMTDRENTFTYAVSKLYFSVSAGEERGNFAEQDFIIDVTPSNYYSVSADSVILKADFAYENNIAKGSILKIFDNTGGFEYYKAENVSVTNVGDVSFANVTLTAPELSEVFSQFDLSSRETLTIDDHDGDLNAEDIKNQFEAHESFEILQNYSLLSAIDYINSKNITNISGATLRDGTHISTGYMGAAPVAEIDKSSTTFDIYSEYLDNVGPKSEDNIKFTCVSGSWRINMGDDTYAIATITVKDGGWIYFGAEGRAKTISDFPWVDIAFSVSAGVEAYEVFEFDIVIYHEGVTYDVREDIEVNGHHAPDVMVSRYRTLLGLEDTDLSFKVQLFEFNVSIWQILNFGFPVSVEFEFSLNGSFAVTIENNWFHIFGFKGGTKTKFEAHHAELYQEQMISTYYNGMFSVRAGIVMGVRFSVLNLSKLGAVGIDFGVGVYFDFYGYGHTYSEYSKILGYYQPRNYWDFFSKQDGYEYKITEYEKESGGSYRELGIYIRMHVVAESDVFKAEARGEIFDLKIALMTAGDDYVVLGFSDKTMELVANGLTADEHGFDLTEYDVNKMKVMYLKTGKVEEIEMNPDYFEFRGVMYVGSFDGRMLNIRDDVVRRGEPVVSQMQITYKGGNIYNSTGAIYLYPEVRYVPFEVDESKVNEKYTVNLTLFGEVYHSFEVPYGTSVMYVLNKDGRNQDSLAPGADWFAANPNYENVNWKYSDLTALITEDTDFAEYVIRKYVRIGYSTGYLSSTRKDFRMRPAAYIWAPVGENLYDVLSDVIPGDLHETVTFAGWDISDRAITPEDDGMVVTALYDFADLTVTVEVKENTVSGREHLKPGTYTYQIKSGTAPYDAVSNHLGVFASGVNAYVSEGPDINQNIFTDAHFVVDWIRTYFTVTFYDPFGQPLVVYNASAFADVSNLMEKPEIKDYDYTSTDGNTLIEFIGWAGVEKLKYLTEDVSINAMITHARRSVKFDPMGGSFKYSFASMDGECYVEDCYYGETIPTARLAMLVPEKTDTNDINYTFAGWYYLDENGEKQFGVQTVTENVTYYAEWQESERLWPVTISGKDILGTLQGSFSDGKTEMILNLPYDEAAALVDAVVAGDYSGIPEEPTLSGADYSVYKWYVIENVGESYTLKPFFTLPNGALEPDTVIIWDIGRGMNFNGETGTYKTVESDGALTFLQWHEPRRIEEDYHLGIFSDSGYYYVFTGWSVLQNGVVSEKNTGDEISVELTGETVYVTAIYEKVPMDYLYTFKVEEFVYDDAVGYAEYWERLHFGGNYYSDQYAIGVTQDKTLTVQELPTATKKLFEDVIWDEDNNRIWEYQFDYWECLETGEESVDMTPDGDRTYVAHFKKVARTVDVTLYAGDNAYFPSTGSQYMEFTNVTAGTEFYVILGMAETPVHNDPVYTFDGWDTFEYLDLTYDTTATAYYWNTEIGCAEGEEDMIRICLDAGADAEFEKGGRYFTVSFEEGDEISVEYLSAFLVVKNGVTYVAAWDFPDGTIATDEIAGTVVRYTRLTEFDSGPEVILFTLDAGEGAVIGRNDERYIDVREFEGVTMKRSYMDKYTVIIDGVEYTAVWEGFEEDVVITADLAGKTITYTELIPVE